MKTHNFDAYYDPILDCGICYELGFRFDCILCRKANREEVTIVRMCMGKDNQEAVVKKSNGKLDVVPIDRLTII